MNKIIDDATACCTQMDAVCFGSGVNSAVSAEYGCSEFLRATSGSAQTAFQPDGKLSVPTRDRATHKIINDPVFGFISVPEGLLLDLIQHPIMQRLTRIRQLGFSSMVYPGAQHTRFQHSLGAYYLMSEVLTSLRAKGNEITDEEVLAAQAVILLHDIGHTPFSHALENCLCGVSHEQLSLLFMQQLNEEFHGALDMAISIFKNEYPKRFLHQLVSGQLDMDRLDYLRRDSFYTGVVEGNIGSARIIKMLDVVDDQIVVEAKGIYSVENYLAARRLMYWQVYLHKTSVACERMLINAIRRCVALTGQLPDGWCSVGADGSQYEWLATLDDTDIWASLKAWCNHEDRVLSMLSQGLVSRRLFKVEVSAVPPTQQQLDELRDSLCKEHTLSPSEAEYLYDIYSIEKNMYDPNDDHIQILYKDGAIRDISEASDMFNMPVLQKSVKKYYLCAHPRVGGDSFQCGAGY